MNRALWAILASTVVASAAGANQVNLPSSEVERVYRMTYADGTQVAKTCYFYQSQTLSARKKVLDNDLKLNFEFYTYDGEYGFKANPELEDSFILAVATICRMALDYAHDMIDEYGDVNTAMDYFYKSDFANYNKLTAAMHALAVIHDLKGTVYQRTVETRHRGERLAAIDTRGRPTMRDVLSRTSNSSMYMVARNKGALFYLAAVQATFGGPQVFETIGKERTISAYALSDDVENYDYVFYIKKDNQAVVGLKISED